MGDYDGLFKIFLLIFVVGSSIASWLKKRQEQQQSEGVEPELEPGPVDLDLEGDPLEELRPPPTLRLQPRPVIPAVPPPLPRPGPPRPAVAPKRGHGLRDLGEASFVQDFHAPSHDRLGEGLDTSWTSSLATEMEGKRLGQFQATAAAELEHAAAWRPSSSWREAVILREVLGPPLALRRPEQPGLPS